MNADTFVERLWDCAPTIEQLISVGLPRDEAESFQLRNRCELRSSYASQQHENAVVDLISRYDVSTLEIGMVRFKGALVRSESWWQVGEVEADPLVINKFTGEIEVRDLADETHMLWRCAMNGATFLAAIARAACFLSRAAYDVMLSEDQGARCAEARECADIAGGSNYRSFYNALLGCDA